MSADTLTKAEWIERAAARYVQQSKTTEAEAEVYARAIFENTHDAINTVPEDEADEDMSYWRY